MITNPLPVPSRLRNRTYGTAPLRPSPHKLSNRGGRREGTPEIDLAALDSTIERIALKPPNMHTLEYYARQISLIVSKWGIPYPTQWHVSRDALSRISKWEEEEGGRDRQEEEEEKSRDIAAIVVFVVGGDGAVFGLCETCPCLSFCHKSFSSARV